MLLQAPVLSIRTQFPTIKGERPPGPLLDLAGVCCLSVACLVMEVISSQNCVLCSFKTVFLFPLVWQKKKKFHLWRLRISQHDSTFLLSKSNFSLFPSYSQSSPLEFFFITAAAFFPDPSCSYVEQPDFLYNCIKTILKHTFQQFNPFRT